MLRSACFVLLLTAGSAVGQAVRFKVAELPGSVTINDAYTLKLTSPADIAHARALIAQGPAAGAPIAVARIAPGADAENRNWQAPGAPAWHWHVTDFVGFADTTIELIDGNPTLVEADVPGWITNTEGMIGFWMYTVVAELPAGACYPNCDGSSSTPVLSANDFACFLNRFAAADEWANCDGSTASPALSANDFVCFLSKFAGGC
jgi:hypothetical protein